jgi:multicomponent Na+:H+ antiporter subunit G
MPSTLELVVAALMLLGTFLTFVACLGLLRLPDVFCRMHAAGKAGTMGMGLLTLAAVVAFAGSAEAVTLRGVLAIFFQFLTAPAATHLLARASYVRGYPIADQTAVDELEAFLPSRPDDGTAGMD